RRRIARVAAAGPLAVALEKRVVRLGPSAGGAADPVARRAGDRLRTPEQPAVHAPERATRRLGRRTAAQTVGEAVLVFEEELPEVIQLREARLAVGDPLRIERRGGRVQEESGRRCLPLAQRVPPLRQTMRLAGGVETQRRRTSDRGAALPPCRLPVRRPLAPAPECTPRHQHGRCDHPPPVHGTNSFGCRDNDRRKTRTLARAVSSSARYASRAALASPPWSAIASCTVGARPSCR